MAFKDQNLNLDNSGFSVIIPAKAVADGKYRIGLYIQKGNLSFLKLTDKVFNKAKDTIFTIDLSMEQNVKLPPSSTTNAITYSIEKLDNQFQNGSILMIAGWAFIKGSSSENVTAYIVLYSMQKIYIFDTKVHKRADVTETYKNQNLNFDNSGFFSYIPKIKLIKGDYLLGILLKNEENGNSVLQYVNQKVKI